MNIEHANRIPMAEILGKLAIQPKRASSNKLLYSSPLHQEKKALLEVNIRTNRWHDHRQGVGGQPVDFVCTYLKYTHEAHTEADALRWLKNMVISAPFEIKPICANSTNDRQLGSPFVLKTKKTIQHLGLIRYVEKQGISLEIAQRFLKEIRVYNIQTKKYFIALGFPNEEGGLELISPFFNGHFGHQTITFIRGRMPKPATIHLFKNVMDYLSVICHLSGKDLPDDKIILNSLSCLERAIPYIQNYGYRNGYTWMDNDKIGENATDALSTFFKTQDDLKHIRMNKLYAPHKDVSAWHRHKLNQIV